MNKNRETVKVHDSRVAVQPFVEGPRRPASASTSLPAV